MLISGPDADSIGAGIVLKRHLRNWGKLVRLVSGNPLISDCDLPLIDEIEFANPPDILFAQYDLIITIDTANPYPQLVNHRLYESFELPSKPPTLSIDHHRGNEGYADYNIWEPESSSVCEMVLIHFLSGKLLTRDEATLLLLGISYDTGHFRWSTSPQTLLIAARLIEMGGDLDLVVNCLYYSYDKSALELMQHWLGRITYNDELGYMAVTLSEQELEKAGFLEEEFKRTRAVFERIFLRAVKGYPIGFFLINNGEIVRAHMFSSASQNRVDLTQLSKLVGGNGGGHFHASGFIVKASVQEIFRRINNALTRLKSVSEP